MSAFHLSNLDIGIMIFYSIAIVAYGLYKGKRGNTEEYFLGGRSMTWPILGISLFAANISSSTLVGLAGDAFKTNTQVFNYEWFATLVLVFFAVFFLPFYLKSKVYTMPEFLERRYDQRSRYYFSFITVIGNVLIDMAASLYVGLLIMRIIFPDLGQGEIISILVITTAIYTVMGGLSSVIHTEVIQAILLILGSCFITYFAMSEVGGWSGMMAKLDTLAANGELVQEVSNRHYENGREMLSLIRPVGDPYMDWLGLILGVPILGFYFWANNQLMVQRILSAKNVNEGRWGALFAGFLKLPVFFIMVIPGTIAIILFSDLDLSNLNYMIANPDFGIIPGAPEKVPCPELGQCSNMTYPVLMYKLLPSGFLGLTLAALLAAMSSSVSATLNSASTLVSIDFVQKLNPNISSKQLVRVGQITTLILVLLAALWAPEIERFGSLFGYLQTILSYIAPPVVAVFILGLFWSRANSTGAFAALLLGFGITVFMVFNNALGFVPALTQVHFLYMTFILLVLCMLMHIIVSLSTAPPDTEQIKDYLWSPSIFRAETQELKGLPWYENYRVWAFLLLLATAILVISFW